MIIHEFDLDMIPDNAITTVKVNQYDDDFNLKINLFSRKGGLTIQAGTEVIIRGKKPDGHVFSADCSINGNVVTVVGNQQMTAAAGRAIFELSLRKNGKELNSANFIMKVERAPMDKDTPPSNSVIRELVDALDHTDEILEAAESVEEWLSTIDDTLSQPNKAADAKKTGDEIADLKSDLTQMHEEIDSFEGISEDVKVALLDVVSHIALWTDGDGQQYYDALYDALYGEEYPDLTTGEVVYGYYLDEEGNPVSSTTNFYNEKYFPIDLNTTYIWVRGFNGFARKENNVITADMLAYRICYYDSNKNFLSRETSYYSSELGVVEARYFTLTPPPNAAFFRVSWTLNPVGNIYRSIPGDLYAVTLILANLDDANISANTDLMSRVSFIRNGVGVLQDVVYGRSDITMANYYGEIPNNNSTGAATFDKSIWFRDVFNYAGGYSPEDSGIHGPNPDTLTRIQNRCTFLMKAGDVIRFNNVKAGVRAERISDGYVQHTSSWITTNTDFVIGGE